LVMVRRLGVVGAVALGLGLVGGVGVGVAWGEPDEALGRGVGDVTLSPFAGHIGCGVSDLGLTPCAGLQT
jgi:hypothetical protein